MKNNIDIELLVLSLLLLFVPNIKSQNVPNPIEISSSSPYSINFDSLSNEGLDIAFPSFSGVLSGWWVTDSKYSATDGSTVEGGVYSYGVWESNERSLGSMPSNAMKRTSFGAAFVLSTNVTQEYVFGLNISFTGELWSANSNSTSTVIFDYCVITTHDYINSWTKEDETFDRWMLKEDLSFSFTPSPSNSQNQLPLQSVSLNHLLAIDDYKTGKVILIRWSHDKIDGRNDHLAINNLEMNVVSFTINSALIDLISTDINEEGSFVYPRNLSSWKKALIFSGVGLFVVIVVVVVVVIARKRSIAKKSKEFSPLLTSINEDNYTGELELTDSPLFSLPPLSNNVPFRYSALQGSKLDSKSEDMVLVRPIPISIPVDLGQVNKNLDKMKDEQQHYDDCKNCPTCLQKVNP